MRMTALTTAPGVHRTTRAASYQGPPLAKFNKITQSV
jgi:hypothetical protein